MDIRVLGPIQVDTAEGPAPIGGAIPRTVLGALIAQAGVPISWGRLIVEVYGPDAADDRRGRIEDTISRLRAAFGADRERIRLVPGGYVLDVEPGAVDADRFDQLLDRGRRLAGTDPKRALQAIDDALQLWRGEPYADTRESGLLDRERRRLQNQHDDAVEEQCALRFALGEVEAVVTQLDHLLADDMLRRRERLWMLQMQALHVVGRHEDALQAARAAERHLADHYLDPSPAFRKLESRMLAHDPTLAPAADRLDVCPYKGLEAYQTHDEHLFHGRRAALDELVATVSSSRIVVVTGRSGVGKSSIVRAGLIPAARRGRLSVPQDAVVTTPGSSPVDGLRRLEATTAAMQSPGLFIIDQAEELFTLGWPADEADRYLGRLAELAAQEPPTRIVVTVRDDLLGRLLEHPSYSPARRQLPRRAETVVIRPMNRAELRDAIRIPAADVGLAVADDLVERLLDDAADPGALPLLSHALLQTWRYADRGRGTLTVADYAMTGGLHAAVGRSADLVYSNMTSSDQALMRRVCLELVEYGGPSRPDSRRPAALHALLRLGDPDTVIDVVERLVAARLLTVSSAGFELVHEALLISWPALVEWIADERERIAFERHLAVDADAWRAAGRDPDLLYRGARLEHACAAMDDQRLDRSQLDDDDEGDVVAQFVAAGIAHRSLGRRQTRRRRLAGAVLVVLLVALTITGGQRLWNARADANARAEALALSPLLRYDHGDGPFGLEQFEVRIEQYRTCVEHGPCAPIDAATTGAMLETADADAPVTWISYRQAQTYCRWAGRRLPTQEELEWAITLGGTRRYPWGERDPQQFPNDEGPLLVEAVVARIDATGGGLELLPVTAGPRALEGAANLVGNVAEWTATTRSAVEAVTTGLGATDSADLATNGEFSTGRALDGERDVGMRCAEDAS